MTKTIVTRARVEGLVIVGLALAYVWQAHQIPDLFQMPGVPGPTAFPMLVGTVFGLGGLWRIFAPSKIAEVEKPWAEGDEIPEDEAPTSGGFKGWMKAHARFYGTWVVLLGYMALMPVIGFPVATVAAFVALFALLGEKRWGMTITVAVVGTAVLWVVFAIGLSVNLPRGLLAGLLN